MKQYLPASMDNDFTNSVAEADKLKIFVCRNLSVFAAVIIYYEC